MIGSNAYYLHRRLMCDYKVNANRGIREWQLRMTQLNNYIMYLPSEALQNRGAVKQGFTEIKMWKILDIALIFQRFKPKIKAEATKAKSDREQANKVYGHKGTKYNSNGTSKVTDAKKTTCKTCGKQHKGKCWKDQW